MTRVAVAILNFNGASLLPRFLPSVIRNSGAADLVLIDNGSTDGSADWTEQNFPQVRVIRLGSNLGFCSGYNEGLKDIRSDVVVLLNSDVEVTEGWLDEPLKLFEQDPRLFSVQPKILRYQERKEFDYAGAGGGFIDQLGYPYCRGRLLDALEEDHGQYDDVQEVCWASGACMFVRLPLFRELGGFESGFFAHMEEIDLCWRAIRNGYQNSYCGRSTVYHLGGGTLPVASPRKTYLNFRNNLSLLTRNTNALKLVWLLPVRLLLDLAAFGVFFLKGSFAAGFSILKAWLDFVGHLPAEMRRRKSVRGHGYGIPVPTGPVGLVLTARYLK